MYNTWVLLKVFKSKEYRSQFFFKCLTFGFTLISLKIYFLTIKGSSKQIFQPQKVRLTNINDSTVSMSFFGCQYLLQQSTKPKVSPVVQVFLFYLNGTAQANMSLFSHHHLLFLQFLLWYLLFNGLIFTSYWSWYSLFTLSQNNLNVAGTAHVSWKQNI